MDFNNRQYDPQIGRFLSVDPLAAMNGQDMFSPYAAMGNTPEGNVDPNGLSPSPALDLAVATGSGGGGGMSNWYRAADPNAYGGAGGYTGSRGGGSGPGSEWGIISIPSNSYAAVLNMLSIGDASKVIKNFDGSGFATGGNAGGKGNGVVELDEDGVVVIRPQAQGFFGKLWSGVKRNYKKGLRAVYDASERFDKWMDKVMGHEDEGIRD